MPFGSGQSARGIRGDLHHQPSGAPLGASPMLVNHQSAGKLQCGNAVANSTRDSLAEQEDDPTVGGRSVPGNEDIWVLKSALRPEHTRGDAANEANNAGRALQTVAS